MPRPPPAVAGGQGAHMRAPRTRSGAMGPPASVRVGFGAQPRLGYKYRASWRSAWRITFAS